MADAADAPKSDSAEPKPAEQDWFKQIPFNPKVGLDSVLPMRLSENLPAIEEPPVD